MIKHKRNSSINQINHLITSQSPHNFLNSPHQSIKLSSLFDYISFHGLQQSLGKMHFDVFEARFSRFTTQHTYKVSPAFHVKRKKKSIFAICRKEFIIRCMKLQKLKHFIIFFSLPRKTGFTESSIENIFKLRTGDTI